MKTIYLLFISIVSLVLVNSCKNDSASSNPDATITEMAKAIAKSKTFIIKYKTEVNYRDVVNVSNSTQWIDVENDRVAIESVSETNMMGEKMKSRDLTIIKNKETWLINLVDKTGFKAGESKLLTGNQTEIIKAEDDATFRQKVEASGGKILQNETFLGKNCIVVELPDSSGKTEMKSKMWYYQGIPLKMTNAYYNMEAVEIQENVDIPAEKFEVPAGITMREMPGMK
jgi:hypothetical protein